MEGTLIEPHEAVKLSGLTVAKEHVIPGLLRRIERLSRAGVTPRLCSIVVGDGGANNLYLQMQIRRASELGIELQPHHFATGTAIDSIINVIHRCNDDPGTHGIIVELPLPEGYHTRAILEAIAPEKDVDSLNGGELFPRPTPTAVHALLHWSSIPLADQKIVVVGSGPVVGAPLVKLLRHFNYNVEVVDIHTDHQLRDRLFCIADVLISAVGKPGLIQATDIRPGATVVDVAGDVAPEVNLVAGAIAPYRGGVGPLTCYFLFGNVVAAAEKMLETA